MPSVPLRVAAVCMSNINGSMEAHSMLQKEGYNVQSHGTSFHVKLPGPRANCPVRYTFATTYKMKHDGQLRTDRELYTQNGVLRVLGRNGRVKAQPEKFQECCERFDVIFTCEESVYGPVVKELCSRDKGTFNWHM